MQITIHPPSWNVDIIPSPGGSKILIRLQERGLIIVTDPHRFSSIENSTGSQCNSRELLQKAGKDFAPNWPGGTCPFGHPEKIVRLVLREMAGGLFAIGFNADGK